jgi:hypothetical protein
MLLLELIQQLFFSLFRHTVSLMPLLLFRIPLALLSVTFTPMLSIIIHVRRIAHPYQPYYFNHPYLFIDFLLAYWLYSYSTLVVL